MKEKLYHYKAKVKRVIDGDSIIVDIDLGFQASLNNMHIQLAGIDAPEPVGRNKEAGEQSKAFLESLIDQKEVFLHVLSKDSFGRYLSEVYLENGTHINALMLEEGYAVKY